MQNLDQKVALISGATRGIGQAIATTLGQAGATIIGTATSQKGADAITQSFKTHKIKGCGLVLDVTKTTEIDEVIQVISKTYGTIDILVNNAGITRDNLLMRMQAAEWDAIIDTNLSSVFRLSKAVLRGMMKQKSGRIISISSVVGATGNPGQTNYAAAKAGIIGFTKSLAREVGSRGITVNAIAPGFIETDMTSNLPEAQKAALAQQIPMSRLGTVDEIAAAALFLASEQASYITSQTLHVNGGMY